MDVYGMDLPLGSPWQFDGAIFETQQILIDKSSKSAMASTAQTVKNCHQTHHVSHDIP